MMPSDFTVGLPDPEHPAHRAARLAAEDRKAEPPDERQQID